MNPKEVSPEMVVIEPSPIPEDSSPLTKTDQSMQDQMKKQNRGTVFIVGKKCEWLKPGDLVSFYRAAGTDLPGTNQVVVAEKHVLVKF